MRLDVKSSAKCHEYNALSVYIMQLFPLNWCKKRKETYFAAIDPFPVKTKSKTQGKGHGIKLLTKYM